MLWERSIFVPGRVKGKGSKAHNRAGAMYESNDAGLAAWTRRATAALQIAAPPVPWDGPCALVVIDRVPRPKSHYVGGDPERDLRRDAPWEPSRGAFPDGDKGLRAVADPLQPSLRPGKDGGGWIGDDARIVLWQMRRVWCGPDGQAPGRTITVRGLPNCPSDVDSDWSAFDGDFSPTEAEIDARIELRKAERRRAGIEKARETRRRRREEKG